MTARRVILEMGTGNDLHGGDYTKAAMRAVQDALHHSSLTMLRSLNVPAETMQVEVTIGVQRPPNLTIAVFDNGRYAETGMQASHTDTAVELTGVARSCGIEAVFDLYHEAALAEFAGLVHSAHETLFARVAIRADEPPRVLPTRDGVFLKTRFRHALGVE